MFLSKNEKIIIKFLQKHPSKNCDIVELIQHLVIFDEESENQDEHASVELVTCLEKLSKNGFIRDWESDDDYIFLTNKCRTYSEPDFLKIISVIGSVTAAIVSVLIILDV